MVYLLSHRESRNGQSRAGLDAILLGKAAERGLLDRMIDDATATARLGQANSLRAAEVSLERAQAVPTLAERIAASAAPAHAAADVDPDDQVEHGERWDGQS